ncbi:hypothetical protein BLOT_009315 [Blomia tropicalis]|nr:hypothetical protein BLOT_009315 [Blomia tropicalis]
MENIFCFKISDYIYPKRSCETFDLRYIKLTILGHMITIVNLQSYWFHFMTHKPKYINLVKKNIQTPDSDNHMKPIVV